MVSSLSRVRSDPRAPGAARGVAAFIFRDGPAGRCRHFSWSGFRSAARCGRRRRARPATGSRCATPDRYRTDTESLVNLLARNSPRARGAGREVSSRGEQGAVRPARAAGAAGSPILFFAMAMAGRIGGARWRSSPPPAPRYGVDVDSTRLRRADGVAPADSLALRFRTQTFCPFARQRRAPIRLNKATANQSPAQALPEEFYSKGRLRVSNWIVQRLNNDAVDQTVELRLLTVF